MSSGALGSLGEKLDSQYVETDVLFVCTGNICRSPVADLILRSLAIPGVHTQSAGTETVVGAEIDGAMRNLLKGDGIDVAGFRARQFTADLAERSDIILTATSKHRGTVLREAPSALRRTFTVRELADLIELAELEGPLEPLARSSRLASLTRLRVSRQPEALDDVMDPYRLSESHYRRAYEVVSSAVRGPIARLLASFTCD